MLINATPEEVKELLKHDRSPSRQNSIKRDESNSYFNYFDWEYVPDWKPSPDWKYVPHGLGEGESQMATTKPTVESTQDRIPIELIISANLKALAEFITNNCKRILNPSNVDEYLDVVHGVMQFVKHYCRVIDQNIKEGDLGDKRAKGT